MDAAKFNSAKNQLKNLKNLFSKFVNVANRISAIHDSTFLPNDPKVNLKVNVGNAIHELDVGSCGSGDFNVTQDEGNLVNDPNLFNNENPMHEFEVAYSGDSAYSNIGNVVDGKVLNQCRSLNNWNAMHELDVGSGSGSGNSNSYYNVRQDEHNSANDPNLFNNENPIHEFEVAYSGDSAYSNIGNIYDGKVGDQCRSFKNGNVMHDVGSSGDGYSNVKVDLSLTRTLSKTQVMGIDLPNDSTFNNKHFEAILNKGPTDTANYIYYLFDDNVAYDSLDVEESEVDVRDHITVGFGSTDDTTVDTVTADNITEQTLKSSNVIITSLNNMSNPSVVPKIVKETTHKSPSENKNIAPFNIDIIRHHGCDNVNMFVPTSDSKAKTHCCVYCSKRYPKLVRHLEDVHKDELDVQKLRNLSIGSKERREIINMIRKRGRFLWNTNEKINGGELSTSRRPNKKFQKKATDYTACAKCFEFLSTRTLRVHWNKCTNNALKGERIVKELGRAVEGRVHPEASDDLNLVFARMREDECVRSIRFDWLIIEFGNDLSLNYSPVTQITCICNQLRNAGKLLVALKSVSSAITDFASLYQVKHCNAVIEAVRIVSRFDLKAKQIGSPGTASNLVTLINNIGDLLVIERMKQDDPVEEKNVERFLKVFKKDSRLKINKLVGVAQAKSKRFRNEDIPTTGDVNRLSTYLDNERNKCFVELGKKYSDKQWMYLAKLTLASILVFNRRRTGEMRFIKVEDFDHRQIISEQCIEAIPEKIRETIRSRMHIRGKLGRPVPVLLKHSYDDCIQLLLQHRQDAGISDRNDYLFAVPTQSGIIKMINACAIMTKFSKACEALNPKSLRGTKLRKHVASMCATMNLTDNDVTNVANFMGHHELVHRKVYRHNPFQEEVVKMTTLLEAAQGNTGSTNAIIASEPSSCVTTKTNGNPKNNRAIITGMAKSLVRKPKKANRSCNIITSGDNSDQAKVGKRKNHQSDTKTKRVKTESRC